MSAQSPIRTVGARQKLSPRREPYWERLATGRYLGYRKQDTGASSWIARWYDAAAGKQHYRSLGSGLDFDAAAKEARAWFEQCDHGATPAVGTVEECCRAYVEHQTAHKSPAAGKDAHIRLNKLVYGEPIGRLALDRLRVLDVQKWLQAQVQGIDGEADPEALRKAKDTANRNLSTFKAALNWGLRARLVASDAGWKTVAPFPKVARRRERYLDDEERTRLLDACGDLLRPLVKALLLTAARPGEIVGATVADFDPRQGTLALEHGKGTGEITRRVCTLSTSAVAFFTGQAKGKIGHAPLVAGFDGAAWRKMNWKRAFDKAVTKAGLPGDVVLYSIRHTAITDLVCGGMDSHLVARLAGRSTAMIDKHYGHLRHDATRAMLDRVRLAG
jgi:integrase